MTKIGHQMITNVIHKYYNNKTEFFNKYNMEYLAKMQPSGRFLNRESNKCWWSRFSSAQSVTCDFCLCFCLERRNFVFERLNFDLEKCLFLVKFSDHLFISFEKNRSMKVPTVQVLSKYSASTQHFSAVFSVFSGKFSVSRLVEYRVTLMRAYDLLVWIIVQCSMMYVALIAQLSQRKNLVAP